MASQSKNPEEVVVVTGGSGFLGQHIVKHLIEQTEFPIREVRVFDVQPLKWHPGLVVKETTDIIVKQLTGDLCKVEDLQSAFKGASVVIHNASFIDVSSLPDTDKLNRVNVNGTRNVIKACIDNNIKILVYTSSGTAVEKLGHYGRSKHQAEHLVLQANNQQLNNGNLMSTCALQLSSMYGEGFTNLVDYLQNSLEMGGENEKMPAAYAGNVAWAFVCAIRQLRSAPSHFAAIPAGRTIGITDETPLVSISKDYEPFAKYFGLKFFRIQPFWMLYLIASICEWISFLLQPFYTLRIPFSKVIIDTFHRLPLYDHADAKYRLNYQPIYSYEESINRTITYLEHFIKVKL